MPGRFESLEVFLAQCRAEAVEEIVCLVSDEEIEEKSADYAAAFMEKRWPLAMTRFPIPDYGIPDDISGLVACVREVVEKLRRGRKMVVHCAAGCGRTGMVAIVLLLLSGIDFPKAREIVENAGSSPETEAQNTLLKKIAASLQTNMKSRKFKALQSIPENAMCIPICVIDLGFSERKPTLGIVFSHEETECSYTFGEGLIMVNNWLARLEEKNMTEAVLIVEAPLSMALTKAYNPCHRKIELQRNYEGAAPRTPKGWFYQAGANLCLGSSVFLSKLSIPKFPKSVHIVEGFYCSISPGEVHAEDMAVAKHLLKCFRTPGTKLHEPKAQSEDGSVFLLPGLDPLIEGIPSVLLRHELTLEIR